MLPLQGLRVLDGTDGRGAGCGRFLADLGADVVLVEPPHGLASRRRLPLHNNVGVDFCASAANKRSVTLDLAEPSDRHRFLALLEAADIWIDGSDPGTLNDLGLAPDTVRMRIPHLVVVSITEFGQWGPYRDRAATDWTHLALTTALSRSGVPGHPPLMPPGSMADGAASVQAAWVALLAYWNRLQTGRGDHLDVSLFEAVAQGLDPATGSIGTAAAAQGGPARARGRPDAHLYPIFPCRDGYVRIVVLAPRQWRAMFEWLGRPAEFSDPNFDQTFERLKSAAELYPLIAELFGEQAMLDLVREGQRRGVPIAPVLTVAQTLDIDHFRERRTFAEVDVGGDRGRLPSGYVLVDRERAGFRAKAPKAGEHQNAVSWTPPPPSVGIHATNSSFARPTADRPLARLRVLDLGVIVVGAEAGRLFADQGADVIKVENRRYPDGARASGMSGFFASGQRNKRSIGIDLRSPDGIAVFERLVAVSDLVLSNFKPGTLESLGLGYDHLSSINPGIVLVTSSAMGEWGPWRDWMGYGPLVRCVSGLTSLWQDPTAESGFGDSSTIYPDHLVGRIVAIAALAALMGRRASGRGRHIESSQAEAIITALAPVFLRESLQPGSAVPVPHGEQDAPWGVYACAGDDEWCVVTVRDDNDWIRLVRVLERPEWTRGAELRSRAGRVAGRAAIDAGLTAWTRLRSPREVTEQLQAARIPAAPMQRIPDFLEDPHLIARNFFRRFHQPGIDEAVVTENGPCVAQNLPAPNILPAPFAGEHTRAVCREVLDMEESEIDRLVAEGALEEYQAPGES